MLIPLSITSLENYPGSLVRNTDILWLSISISALTQPPLIWGFIPQPPSKPGFQFGFIFAYLTFAGGGIFLLLSFASFDYNWVEISSYVFSPLTQITHLCIHTNPVPSFPSSLPRPEEPSLYIHSCQNLPIFQGQVPCLALPPGSHSWLPTLDLEHLLL